MSQVTVFRIPFFRHNIWNLVPKIRQLGLVTQLCRFSNFFDKILHGYCWIIQHYLRQILIKSVEI